MTTDRFHSYVIAAMFFIGLVAMRSDGAVSQTRDLIELDNRVNALWRAGKLGEAIPLTGIAHISSVSRGRSYPTCAMTPPDSPHLLDWPREIVGVFRCARQSER